MVSKELIYFKILVDNCTYIRNNFRRKRGVLMLYNRRLALRFLIVIVSLYYGWNYIFSGNERMITLGASAFPIIACLVSFLWIFKVYRTMSSKHRYFWLILSIGMFINITANAIWFFQFIFLGITDFPDMSYLLWLVAYLFFLVALIYKTMLVSRSTLLNPFIFNIAIFVIIATSMSIYYLIEPILILSDYSLSMIIINVAFQITNLSILFVVTLLYYLSRHSSEKKLMIFIIVGFFVQIIADSSFAYLSIIGTYQSGSVIDPIWMISTLVIGFGGLYAQGGATEPKWDIPDYFKNTDTLFPYLSSVFLTYLVINSYKANLNALSIGLTIVFLIIIARQFIIINKNKRLMSEYKHLAYHDSLTGLKNRTSFKKDVCKIIENAEQENRKVAILSLDLDRFKLINDTLGHHIGDRVLMNTALRLKNTLGNQAQIYRLGGDEFVLVFPGANEKKCRVYADKIIKEFSVPFFIAHHQITMTPSIGISFYPENGEDYGSLLKSADAAMYLAKESGRNKYCFYNIELHEQMTRKMKIENQLRSAIGENQLQLFYQPRIDLQTKGIYGMEALLRWDHPELGSISPVEFIPVAEDTGQILSIGEWVLKKACKQNKFWQQAGYPFLSVSVNVSVRQFQRGDFVELVKKTLLETGLDPQYLELEITESVMQNVEESSKILIGLRKLGVKIAIDDFGTGYSSLHILKELPIDIIKIDKSFIDDITEISNNESIVKAIINIGLNLNLDIVAEGIENEHQLEALVKYKCRFGQGYLFQKPIDAVGFEELLKKQRVLI